MLAWMLSLILPFMVMVGGNTEPAHVVTVPAQSMSEEDEWSEYHAIAYSEYAAEFDALYGRLEVKWSKNGRLMMRAGNTGPFKFVKRTV